MMSGFLTSSILILIELFFGEQYQDDNWISEVAQFFGMVDFSGILT
jgi:hypothetical protein